MKKKQKKQPYKEKVAVRLYTHQQQEGGGCLTFLHVMLGKGSPSASQGITSSLPASCLYSPPGTTENLGGSCIARMGECTWIH